MNTSQKSSLKKNNGTQPNEDKTKNDPIYDQNFCDFDFVECNFVDSEHFKLLLLLFAIVCELKVFAFWAYAVFLFVIE